MEPTTLSTPSSPEFKPRGMAMRINPNYSLIERSPSPPPPADTAAIIDMPSETEKVTTEQPAPQVPAIAPAQPSPPPPSPKSELNNLSPAARTNLRAVFQCMSFELPPHLQKNAARRRNLNKARVGLFFAVWLIQSSYVFGAMLMSLYRMIKSWMVKGCSKHAAKLAAATCDAVCAAKKENHLTNSQVWGIIGTVIPIVLLVWYSLYRLYAPLRSSGRQIFFEGCVACFTVFQATSALIIVFARASEQGVYDWYNIITGTSFLVLLILTAIVSASFLEEVEYLSWDMPVDAAEAVKAKPEPIGDAKV